MKGVLFIYSLVLVCLVYTDVVHGVLNNSTFPRLVNIYAYSGSVPTVPYMARYHALVSGVRWAKAGVAVGMVKKLNPEIIVVEYIVSEEAPIPGYNGLDIYPGWWLTLAGSQLTAPINSTQTVIPVNSSSPFSYLPSKTIIVDHETMLVESVNTANGITTITVQRGYYSNVTSHAINTRVAPVASFWPGTSMLNMSPYCPVNPSTGLRWMDYLPSAAKALAQYAQSDGIFFDNAFCNGAGLNRDLIDVDNNNIADQGFGPSLNGWNDAQRFVLSETKNILPSNQSIVVANSGTWTGTNGRFYESVGISVWGHEVVNMVMQYLAVNELSALNSPTYMFIGVDTANTNLQNLTTMRSGLFMTLLGNGYYSYDSGDKAHGQPWWYDEFDNGAGSSLVANITTSDTILHIAAGTGSKFRAGDVVWVPGRSGQEAMLVNSVNGDTLNVTRAYNQTTLNNHTVTDKVFTEAQVRAGMGYLGAPLGLAKSETLNSPNLIVGGDFEGANYLANWTTTNNLANCSVSQDSITKLTGSSSLRFDISSPITSTNYWNAYNSIYNQVPFSLTKGTLYTLTVSAKSDRFMWFSFSLTFNKLNNYTAYTFNNIPNFWQNFTFQFVAAMTTNDYNLRIAVGQGKGSIWIDNVKLQEGSPHLYTRYYANGLVVSNMKRLPANFTVPNGYSRILGTQDPQLNNGKDMSQSTITLLPTEGAIFVKTPTSSGPSTSGSSTVSGSSTSGASGTSTGAATTTKDTTATTQATTSTPTITPGSSTSGSNGPVATTTDSGASVQWPGVMLLIIVAILQVFIV